jgi:hypothetical protein
VRFQVLTAESMNFRIIFWDVPPCKIIVDRRFRGTCCLHHQGWTMYVLPPSSGMDHPWWWRQHVPLKRRSTIILHGSTSQKTILKVTINCFRTWGYKYSVFFSVNSRFRKITFTDMAVAGTHNALRRVNAVYPTTACSQHFLLWKKAAPRLTIFPICPRFAYDVTY